MSAAPKMNETMLDWALHYARAGFEVFPVSDLDKAPLVGNGFYDATSDPAQITRQWARWPNALVAARIPANMIVLDIDPRHGGDATLAELETSYGPLPTTRKHRSGRGDDGGHLWWLRPPSITLSTKPLDEWARQTGTGHQAGKRKWSSGIDLLHHDLRYTILPPSLHPDSHKPYEWLSKEPVAELPAWFTHLLTKPAAATPPPKPLRIADSDSIADWYSSHTSWNDILGDAGWERVEGDGDSDGSKWRHPNATAANSCSIQHGCLFVYTPNTDFEQTDPGDPRGYTRFRAWATLEHDGDMTAAARAARTARDGHHSSSSTNTTPADTGEEDWTPPIPLGDTDDVPAFPTEALPEWLADYATSVAEEVQVAVDLPALMGLVALSVANAGRYKVQVTGNGWTEQLNLYIVVALPPSAGKSPVVNKMLGAIHTHELDNRRKVEERIEHVALKRRIIEKAMKRAEDKGDVGEAQRCHDELTACPLPVIPRYIADDATPEALAALMHEQGGRLALISTEGGPFDIMAGRYSDRANLDVYLKAWGGDQLRVDRINRPAIVIANPTLTVGLTVQPQVISALAAKDEFKGRGLTARMMYSVPTDFVGYRNLYTVPTHDPALRHEYDNRILDMIRPEVPLTPELITLSNTAQTNFMSWRQSLEDRRRPDGDLRPMAEWSTKLESSVARVAGLLALCDGHTVIDETTMNRAIAVGAYWLQHAKVVHDMWQVDPRIAAARTIVDWLSQRDDPDFSVRDLYAGLRRTFPTADDTREPLGLLTERGWIRPLFDGPLILGRRGKDSPRYSVNPLSLWITTTHARHARNSLRGQFCSLSSSFPFSTFTAPSAHGAHGAHEPPDHPEAQPPPSTTNSDELDQGPF